MSNPMPPTIELMRDYNSPNSTFHATYYLNGAKTDYQRAPIDRFLSLIKDELAKYPNLLVHVEKNESDFVKKNIRDIGMVLDANIESEPYFVFRKRTLLENAKVEARRMWGNTKYYLQDNIGWITFTAIVVDVLLRIFG